MSDDRWVVIPNWARFQHYSDRDMLWIKVYTDLAHHDEWRHLTLSERGLLVCIWIEYGLSRCQLRYSDIPAAVAQKVPRRSIDSLVEAGLLQLSASKPSRARARAQAKEEERREEPLPLTPSASNNHAGPTNPRALGTNPRAKGTNPRAPDYPPPPPDTYKACRNWLISTGYDKPTMGVEHAEEEFGRIERRLVPKGGQPLTAAEREELLALAASLSLVGKVSAAWEGEEP